jgi:hypothetical protein
MRRMLALVALLTTLIGVRAPAQQMRGIVRDSTAGTPLAGAIVIQLDSAGRSGARSITGADGRFAITVTPSTARLRVMRIGYHLIDVVLPGDRKAAINVAMVHLPPILDVIRVMGSELCPGSPAQGAAFEIWEQARTGLLATIVARDLNPARVKTLRYVTTLSPNDLRVRKQTKEIVAGSATRPFASSARSSFFANVGYMIEDGRTRIFNAPDADVLTDESFASTHCFRLRRADAAHPGQVGVAFSPVDGRDTLVDVQGVIWIDAAAPQVRSLDFTYTSLEPAAMAAHVGGHIDFRTMPNGISFIERWYIRLAALDAPLGGVHRMTSTAITRRTDLTDLKLRELTDAGGVVLNASWPDGSRFIEPPSTVSGVVVGKETGTPTVHALVRLVGTPDTVTTDSVGHFRIETIPGKYTLEAIDTTISAFVAPRSQSTQVEIQQGADAAARFALTPIDRMIDCHDQPTPPPNSGLIVGAIAVDGGDLPRDAFVEATFQHIRYGDFITTTQKISLDDRGRFFVCGAPRDRKVQLALKTPNGKLADTSAIIDANEYVHKVLWLVPRP